MSYKTDKYPTGYQPKIDYWMDMMMKIAKEFGDNKPSPGTPDYEFYKQHISKCADKLTYFKERQQQWLFQEDRKKNNPGPCDD